MVTETIVGRELPVAIATSQSKDHPSMPYMPYPMPFGGYGDGAGFGGLGGGLIGGLLLGSLFGNRFGFNNGGCSPVDNGNLQATLGVATAEQTSTLLQSESAATALINAGINRVGDGVLATAASTAAAICESTKDAVNATRASQDALSAQIGCGNKEITNQLWNLSTLTQKGFCDVQMQSAMNTKDIQLQAEQNTCKILGAVESSKNEIMKQANDIVLQQERDKILVLQNRLAEVEGDAKVKEININIGQLNAVIASITAQLGTLSGAVSTLAARSPAA